MATWNTASVQECELSRSGKRLSPQTIHAERGTRVGGDDERPRHAEPHIQPAQFGGAKPRVPACRQDSAYRLASETGNAQQQFARSGVHINRPEVRMTQRPGELWVDVEIQIGPRIINEFANREAVLADQLIRLL
jgi:hypothetical protein